MQITKRNNLGLSLIELMMTLAVLATLISVAAPAFGKLIQSTEAHTSRSALTKLEMFLPRHRALVGFG